MWLFANPKSYSDMLKKISFFVFFIILIFEIIASYFSNNISSFFSKISLGLEYENNGIKLYISFFYAPILFAFIERILKMHDIISDIFSIRYNFDKNIILKNIFGYFKFNKDVLLAKVNKKNRESIMRDVFYKYVGYASPKIDPHLIYTALDAWCWYWIFLDSIFVIVFIGIIYLAYNFSWLVLVAFVSVEIILLIFLYLMKHFSCTKNALNEIEEIMKDNERKSEIRKYIIKSLK